jgi:hypothetical protein
LSTGDRDGPRKSGPPTDRGHGTPTLNTGNRDGQHKTAESRQGTPTLNTGNRDGQHKTATAHGPA